ncbi:MAG: hypothetical protein ACN4E0_05485 [Qipengyuania sp.]
MLLYILILATKRRSFTPNLSIERTRANTMGSVDRKCGANEAAETPDKCCMQGS